MDPLPAKKFPLHLSQTLISSGRTLPIDSPEWHSLQAKIITRDNRTCAYCAYMSPHPEGRGLKIDYQNGDVSDNDKTNLSLSCPPCRAIQRCGFSGMKGWVQLAKSDMEQVEIVRRTRQLFEESGKVPKIREIDPLASLTKRDILDLAAKLRDVGWENLTEEEKGLRGFFTSHAGGMFMVTTTKELHVHSASPEPGNASNSIALKILETERSLPWIRFSTESHLTIRNFVATWPPSTTLQSHVAWICVDNGRPLPDDNNNSIELGALFRAWDNVCAFDKPVATDLDRLARCFNTLSGKWMVFAKSTQVDSLWSRIASATRAGTLGTAAKVSPKNDDDRHVICVYNRDYTDEDDVDKVRNGLRRLGVRWKIGYKPDIYTHCRVYRGNTWNIPPTRYFS